jgi:hypothetical protein
MSEIEKYYYFKLRNGKPYQIKESLIYINPKINRLYVELSEEQLEYYLNNPTASALEVWNYDHVSDFLKEYAAEKLKALKTACYDAIEISFPEFAMAIDKVENPAAICYYDLTEAAKIISDFRSNSRTVMGVYDTYKPRINAAQSVEAIDSLYEEAISSLSPEESDV